MIWINETSTGCIEASTDDIWRNICLGTYLGTLLKKGTSCCDHMSYWSKEAFNHAISYHITSKQSNRDKR
jgi:hypothetical protein